MSGHPARKFSDRLERRLAWDLPGHFSGAARVEYERTVAPDEMRLAVREGGAAAPPAPPMRGDFSAVLESLARPRMPRREAAPTLPAGSVRRKAGGVEWRMTGLRSTAHECGGVRRERHELLDWRWWSGPGGQAPGGAPKFLPAGAAKSRDEGPVILAAPLAAFLLRAIARAGGAAAGLLAPLSDGAPFDDDGLPPEATGLGARRTPEFPWPHPAPAAVTLPAPGGLSPETLPVCYLAASFVRFESDGDRFHWRLPLVLLRAGEPAGWAGLHESSGRAVEWLGAVQAAGGRRAGYGLAPRGESPALALRPLSKLSGRLHDWSPDPHAPFASEPALVAARALIRELR